MPVARTAWGDLDGARARAVAEELYAEERAAGALVVGAKVAVTDRVAQARLGADGPFSAPVMSNTLLEDGSTLSLGDLIAPVLEVEIGLHIEDGRATPIACIEIADCRVRDWDVTIAHLVADFGAQARMIFGRPGAVAHDITVTVTHDDAVVATGSRGRAFADAGLSVAREALDTYADRDAVLYVATGAILAPQPLRLGRWAVDFGSLGRLGFEVKP